MAIAPKLAAFLEQESVEYRLVPHPHTESSMVTAAAAHVSGDLLAKAVIVKEADAFLMVIVPSDYHVHLGHLHRHRGREVGLATEEELVSLFPDCDLGAIPPLGRVYGLESLVDEILLELPEVYFEAGDHEHLVKVSGEQFRSLLADAEAVAVGRHV